MSDWHHHHLGDDIHFHKHAPFSHDLDLTWRQRYDTGSGAIAHSLTLSDSPECRADPRQCVYRAHDDT